eukprot:scaffold574_cov246-Pinguiococcus_pyrenoidosus.AAC.12
MSCPGRALWRRRSRGYVQEKRSDVPAKDFLLSHNARLRMATQVEFRRDRLEDEYKPVRRIGKGSSGEVFEVEHMVTGKRYALKRCTVSDSEDVTLEDLKQEIALQCQVQRTTDERIGRKACRSLPLLRNASSRSMRTLLHFTRCSSTKRRTPSAWCWTCASMAV